MKQNNLNISYDSDADILEIFIGNPSPSLFEEIEDDIFEGKDEETNELTGFKIFNFRKRGRLKDVRIQLPAHVIIAGDE